MGAPRKRVAILAPVGDARAGGVDRFCRLLADALSSDFDVEVVAAPTVQSRWLARFGISDLARARKSRDALLKSRPDIVITNGSIGFVGKGSWRRIHVYHGTMPIHSFKDRRGRKLRDWLLAGVLGGSLSEFVSGIGSRRVAVSQSAAQEVSLLYGFRNVRIIENGVPIPPRREGHRSGIVFVGRRESRKGYEAAISVAEALGEKLRVAGPGSDPRTVDLGLLNSDSVTELFQGSTAFVFPTLYEACSFAILESLAAGCPVITRPVGWMVTLLEAVPSYRPFVFAENFEECAVSVLLALRRGDPSLHTALRAAQNWVLLHNSADAFRASWLAETRDLAGVSLD